MRKTLAILVASVLLVSSFTFSSCKKCSKDQPGRDGNTNNKPSASSTIDDSKTPTQIPSPDIPTDISTLKQQIKCQLGKMAAQLVVARNAAKAAQAADSAVTGKSMVFPPTSIAKEPGIENAKRLVEMADNANTEAQKFAATSYQKEAAQADPEAMILVKAVELVSAQITAQVASARCYLAHILHKQMFNAVEVAWYALALVMDQQSFKNNILQVEHWYDDVSEEKWNEVDQYALRLDNRKKKAINDMKIHSQARFKSKTENTYKLAAQESKKASDAAEKLEGEVGQAVLDMVKAAVIQAEAY
jgi:hypothetical protein